MAAALVDGRAEVSRDLQKKTHEVAEALAELDYIAVVLTSKPLGAPVVHGAEGPRRANPQERALAKPEEEHGELPPLNVQNLQLDAYYRTSDGVLHGDEVKN